MDEERLPQSFGPDQQEEANFMKAFYGPEINDTFATPHSDADRKPHQHHNGSVEAQVYALLSACADLQTGSDDMIALCADPVVSPACIASAIQCITALGAHAARFGA